MSEMFGRTALTPAEFDARCRRLVSYCPELSETSGTRSAIRNGEVGGNPASKHLLGMARDFVPDNDHYGGLDDICITLGLWFLIHGVSSGKHLHVQGLAPGDVPAWWTERFG